MALTNYTQYTLLAVLFIACNRKKYQVEIVSMTIMYSTYISLSLCRIYARYVVRKINNLQNVGVGT
jgi:hypothetical protein